jgi:hypothetical protein
MKLGPGESSAAPWRVVPVRDFVRLVLDSRTHDRPWILAVDGRGGNGKSTIADLLRHAVPSSMVVHTDDIAWHHSFFDWSDLLIEHILKPLHSGKTAVKLYAISRRAGKHTEELGRLRFLLV